MSKYKIYRIDHYDPIWIGKRRRRINTMYAVMSFVFIVIFLLVHEIFDISFMKLYIITILVIGGFYFYFYRKLKAENQKIITIGDIEFTKTAIIKHIGDSSTEYSYNSIISIELQRHIPALTAAESKSGFYTYILSLVFIDSHKESLVVSDRPLGKWRDLSITETIKTLKKIISADVILK
jgi:hypothetical protein